MIVNGKHIEVLNPILAFSRGYISTGDYYDMVKHYLQNYGNGNRKNIVYVNSEYKGILQDKEKIADCLYRLKIIEDEKI